MDVILELLKAVLFGIVEGITEWLPISSTGHMILLDQLVKLKVSEEFYEIFQVVSNPGGSAAVFPQAQPLLPQKEPQSPESDLAAVVQGGCGSDSLRRAGTAAGRLDGSTPL